MVNVRWFGNQEGYPSVLLYEIKKVPSAHSLLHVKDMCVYDRYYLFVFQFCYSFDQIIDIDFNITIFTNIDQVIGVGTTSTTANILCSVSW